MNSNPSNNEINDAPIEPENENKEIFNSNLEYDAVYEKSQNFEVDEAHISKNLVQSEKFDENCLQIEDFTCYSDKVSENKRFDKFFNHYLTKEDDKKFLASVNETFQKKTFNDFKGHLKAGPLSTLENLVELTYNSNPKLLDTMVEQVCSLEKIVFRWRTIGGDGNCYYRSIIFCYMENIVFEKNTALLKKIISDIFEKFEGDYPNLQKLPFAIKRDILNLKKKVLLHLLYLIHYFLDKSTIESYPQSEKDRYLNLSYELLLKSFNLVTDFDLGLVYYFRFMLYEYILENHDKMMHKEFPVCLGNLLPQEYETDDGKFLWDKFFREHLLKLGIYAEKIVIYLTPYVLKTNVKLLMYDYGSEYLIETKKFFCHLPNKEEIVTLYRKCHYDVTYSKSYFDKYSKFISGFVNLNEEIKVLRDHLLSNFRKNNVSQSFHDYERMQSVCFTNKKIEKKEKKKEEEPKMEKVDDHNNSTKVEDNSTLTEDYKKSSSSNTSGNTKKEDVIDINSYDQFEKDDHLVIFSKKYKDFLVKSKDLYLQQKFVEILKLKNDSNKIFNFLVINSDTQISKSTLISEIKTTKSSFCCICLVEVKDKKVKFPCDCYVCSDKCFQALEKLMMENYGKTSINDIINPLDINLMCLCSNVYNGEDMRKLYQLLKKHNYLEGVKKILSSFTNRFINCCLQCNQTLSVRDSTCYKKINLKDKDIMEIFNFKRFTHKICSSCYATNVKRYKNQIKLRTSIQCFICCTEHEVINS